MRKTLGNFTGNKLAAYKWLRAWPKMFPNFIEDTKENFPIDNENFQFDNEAL